MRRFTGNGSATCEEESPGNHRPSTKSKPIDIKRNSSISHTPKKGIHRTPFDRPASSRIVKGILKQRYNAYGPWLRHHFGCRVYKLSVDGGFTCPNRDGSVAWGGCTYCNNDSFRPEGAGVELSISEQIGNGIEYLHRRFKAERFIVYWQNFSNTYAPVDRLRALYSTALNSDRRIVGMSIGTRPDCIEDEKLDM